MGRARLRAIADAVRDPDRVLADGDMVCCPAHGGLPHNAPRRGADALQETCHRATQRNPDATLADTESKRAEDLSMKRDAGHDAPGSWEGR